MLLNKQMEQYHTANLWVSSPTTMHVKEAIWLIDFKKAYGYYLPAGNAFKYLSPPDKIDLSVSCASAPYTSRLDTINCFGINPNGDIKLCSITIGNIYRQDVLDIITSRFNYECYSWYTCFTGITTYEFREILKHAFAWIIFSLRATVPDANLTMSIQIEIVWILFAFFTHSFNPVMKANTCVRDSLNCVIQLLISWSFNHDKGDKFYAF